MAESDDRILGRRPVAGAEGSRRDLEAAKHSSWYSDPWVLAVGGAVVSVVLTEISPFHFVSAICLPLVLRSWAFLGSGMLVQRWTLGALFILGMMATIGVRAVVRLTKGHGPMSTHGLLWIAGSVPD